MRLGWDAGILGREKGWPALASACPGSEFTSIHSEEEQLGGVGFRQTRGYKSLAGREGLVGREERTEPPRLLGPGEQVAGAWTPGTWGGGGLVLGSWVPGSWWLRPGLLGHEEVDAGSWGGGG